MAVSVRVQNFQSVVDATLEIDGLTVVTGSNNSGKTAVMRAVQGVFTNAPAGPLVRQGASHLTVTLNFDDGTEIIWEKGWEKPTRKGKTINRYTLNGKALANVGRGPPPEISTLGVREIQAASDKVWPQVAQQFDGTLFLLNRPGAAIAEALSDVDKVGKLSRALRLSEKDRRSVSSELKIRRKDVRKAQEEVDYFEGLAVASCVVGRITESDLTTPFETLGEASTLLGAYSRAVGEASLWEGFDSDFMPAPESLRRVAQLRRDSKEAATLAGRLGKAAQAEGDLRDFSLDVVPDSEAARKVLALQALRSSSVSSLERLGRAQSEVEKLEGFVAPNPPDSERLWKIQHLQRLLGDFISRLTAGQQERDILQGFSGGESPTSAPADQASEDLGRAQDFLVRLGAAASLADSLRQEKESCLTELCEAVDEVDTLLGERGICPTCNLVHVSEDSSW